MQYVVRTIEEIDGESKFKVFSTKPAAQAFFLRQVSATDMGEIEIASLFEVDCDEVRDAVEAVKAGDKKRVGFLAQRLSKQARLASWAKGVLAVWSLEDYELP